MPVFVRASRRAKAYYRKGLTSKAVYKLSDTALHRKLRSTVAAKKKISRILDKHWTRKANKPTIALKARAHSGDISYRHHVLSSEVIRRSYSVKGFHPKKK